MNHHGVHPHTQHQMAHGLLNMRDPYAKNNVPQQRIFHNQGGNQNRGYHVEKKQNNLAYRKYESKKKKNRSYEEESDDNGAFNPDIGGNLWNQDVFHH